MYARFSAGLILVHCCPTRRTKQTRHGFTLSRGSYLKSGRHRNTRMREAHCAASLPPLAIYAAYLTPESVKTVSPVMFESLMRPR